MTDKPVTEAFFEWWKSEFPQAPFELDTDFAALEAWRAGVEWCKAELGKKDIFPVQKTPGKHWDDLTASRSALEKKVFK